MILSLGTRAQDRSLRSLSVLRHSDNPTCEVPVVERLLEVAVTSGDGRQRRRSTTGGPVEDQRIWSSQCEATRGTIDWMHSPRRGAETARPGRAAGGERGATAASEAGALRRNTSKSWTTRRRSWRWATATTSSEEPWSAARTTPRREQVDARGGGVHGRDRG